jgi:hypothetical protein
VERIADGIPQPRHGTTCPGHLSPHSAGSDRPDKPIQDGWEEPTSTTPGTTTVIPKHMITSAKFRYRPSKKHELTPRQLKYRKYHPKTLHQPINTFKTTVRSLYKPSTHYFLRRRNSLGSNPRPWNSWPRHPSTPSEPICRRSSAKEPETPTESSAIRHSAVRRATRREPSPMRGSTRRQPAESSA